MDSIRLEFRATECNGWPTIRILIDDDLYHDYQFSQEHEMVELPIDLLDGEHQLDIEIYGKKSNSTIVDATGKIIQDQLTELLDIHVNDIKLPHYFKYNSIYRFNNQEHPQSLIWGCNGVWSWEFGTPIITWALDFKNNHQAKYNQINEDDLINSHVFNQTRINKTVEVLDHLSKELDRLDDV